MRSTIFLAAALGCSLFAACGSTATNVTVKDTAKPAPTAVPTANAAPVPTASVPKNGDYTGKGKVTKIDVESRAVELDHQEIKGVMPAMKMEFFVIDPALLNGVAVGDSVDFTLRYKDGQEIITTLAKAK